jgi:hypothetical protein
MAHHVGDLKRVALLVEHQRREAVAEVIRGRPHIGALDLAVDLRRRNRSDPGRLARWLPYALSPASVGGMGQLPKSAASVALVERPEGNQWILLAPWGKRYLRTWRAYERGDGEKPQYPCGFPADSFDGRSWTRTRDLFLIRSARGRVCVGRVRVSPAPIGLASPTRTAAGAIRATEASITLPRARGTAWLRLGLLATRGPVRREVAAGGPASLPRPPLEGRRRTPPPSWYGA